MTLREIFQLGNMLCCLDRLLPATTGHSIGTKMLSDVDCRSLAEQCLARIAQQCGEDLVLMDRPFETPATLVFTYQTSDFVATGDFTNALAGNGPILVSKVTGTVEVAGTALPIENYIRQFEAANATSA